jgi:hypothetical protein
MKKLYKIPALMVFTGMLFFSCGNESKTDTTRTDTLVKAADTVQIAAPSPEQLLEQKKQAILNSTNPKMTDVYDWLNQFEVLKSNSIENNIDSSSIPQEYQTPENMVNKVTNTAYKNGIQLIETFVHEGQMFELFIPYLTKKEAKKLINRLCVSMGGGGCLGSDEIQVIYTETKDGVKVIWGIGC